MDSGEFGVGANVIDRSAADGIWARLEQGGHLGGILPHRPYDGLERRLLGRGDPQAAVQVGDAAFDMHAGAVRRGSFQGLLCRDWRACDASQYRQREGLTARAGHA